MHVAMEVPDVLSFPSSGTGTVHRMVVGQVFPIKSSSKQKDIKYFDSQFTDGMKTLQLASIVRAKATQLQN